MERKERIKNLRNLLNNGRLSPKLRTATRELIYALKIGKISEIKELSYLHQHISSGWRNKEYEYNEDDNYNRKMTGTTAYEEFDAISHGDY